jgi:hypothetical protein
MLNLNRFDFILAPTSYHDSFLRLKSPQLTDTFMLLSKEQWLSELQVDVDEDLAIPYLILHHDLSLTMAKTICRLLNFVPPLDSHPRLNTLRMMYDGLKQKGALIQHPFSTKKYANKTIGIYGYHPKDPELLKHLKDLNIHVEWISLQPVSTPPSVMAYPSLVDEVTAFYNKVASLLHQGVSLDSIYLIQPSEDYMDEFIRQSHYFHIPVQLQIEPSFFTYPIAQTYLTLLTSWTADEAVNQLTGFSDEHVNFLKRLIDETDTELKASFLFPLYIKDLFLETKLPSLPYKHAIQVVDARLLRDHEHLFILGFNQGSYPLISRDTGYLSDQIKETLLMTTTSLENEITGIRLKDLILQSDKVYLSLRTLSIDKPLLPSSLVQTLNLPLRDGQSLPVLVDYQDDLGTFTYVLKKEKANRYYHQDHTLSSFESHHLSKLPLPYDPSFKGLPKMDDNQPLSLSYTSVNHFYQCQYKYYLNDVLKLDPNEDPYYLNLGQLTHKVFETVKSDLSMFDQIFDDVLHSMPNLSAKEKMIFSHLKSRIYDVVHYNALHQDHMIHPTMDEEVKFRVPVDEQTVLKGTIDKIILTKDHKGNTFASLMDYKSGLESFKPNLVPHGLSLQLPIYALLMDKHLEYEGVEVIGIYIQHILSTNLGEKELEIDDKSFSSSFKLDGIFSDDKAKLDTFDQSYHMESSKFVKGLSLKKDGTIKSKNRPFSHNQLKALKDQAWAHVEDAKKNIRESTFTINPKSIAGKEVCETCPFQDVCYRRKEDIKVLQIEKNHEDEEELDHATE